MSGIEKMKLGGWKITEVRWRVVRGEHLVVLPPNNDSRLPR